MKITIYVKYTNLKRLYKFLHGENKTDNIEWYHDRPTKLRFIKVTIDYDDFVKLDDR